MKKSYIIHAKRTPIGRIGGALAPVRVDDLMALLLKDYVDKSKFDPLNIDDIIIGCANQAGEDNRNLARMAGIIAGIPFDVPGTTINRLCGSSLDAVIDACGRIAIGLADCLLVGGAESMSRGPFIISKPNTAYGRDSKMYDSTFGWRFPNPKMEKLFPLHSMGETAENVAEQFNIPRNKQDQFALESHQKAIAAQKSGLFEDEILSIPIQLKKKAYTVNQDEGPRKETSLAKLSQLKPVFRSPGTITAGNASTMNDGASLVVIVSETFLKKHNLSPLAEITGFGVRGLHPNVMGLGPVKAVQHLCKTFNKKVDQFDIIEINEAFAAQALACIQELEIDPKKVNLNGGAIALGHPLGCSGTRILTTLTHLMKKNPQFKQGLATMCIGVGQGIALSIKRCQ